jgi:hypothetical protein
VVAMKALRIGFCREFHPCPIDQNPSQSTVYIVAYYKTYVNNI